MVEVLQIAGLVAVIVGAFLLSLALGLIVVGVLVVCLGEYVERVGVPAKAEDEEATV